jgi:hypothetical protein
VAVVVQAAPHRVVPPVHCRPQVPPEQTSPLAQALPQPPQF